MYYEKRLTIPKNTPEANPVEAAVDIHPGVVQHVEVFFPPGCCALAHIRIFYWEHQVWPSNVDSDFTGDGQLISFPEDLEVSQPPLVFTVKGWNLDDTYPHTPIIRFQIVPFEQSLRLVMARIGQGPTGPITTLGG